MVWPEHDDDALTFCDQCGHLQAGVRSACEKCGVLLDRSVYDPFVTISQNAAIVRQAVRGGAKPSGFGKFALLLLGAIYLVNGGFYVYVVATGTRSILALGLLVLHIFAGFLILAGFRRMQLRDSWSEYRRWSA